MAKRKNKLEEMSESELLYMLIADKLNTVDPNNIFYTDKKQKADGTWYYIFTLAGKNLTDNQVRNLNNEARALKSMELYKIITTTLANDAKKTMFEKAVDFDGMKAGKAMLHTISVIETIVNNLTDIKLSPDLSTVGGKK